MTISLMTAAFYTRRVSYVNFTPDDHSATCDTGRIILCCWWLCFFLKRSIMPARIQKWHYAILMQDSASLDRVIRFSKTNSSLEDNRIVSWEWFDPHMTAHCIWKQGQLSTCWPWLADQSARAIAYPYTPLLPHHTHTHSVSLSLSVVLGLGKEKKRKIRKSRIKRRKTRLLIL